MKPTYKKLKDGTIEVTVYEEKKFIVKKAQLEERKAYLKGTEAASIAQIDKDLTRFDSPTADIVVKK